MPHDDLAEIIGDVADGAIVAILTAMRIVAAMAIDALVAYPGRIAGPAVTGRADQPLVTAGKGKFRLAVMIERPGLPVERVVAVLAGRR